MKRITISVIVGTVATILLLPRAERLAPSDVSARATATPDKQNSTRVSPPPQMPTAEDIQRLVARVEADGYAIHDSGNTLTASNGRQGISAHWSAESGLLRVESLDFRDAWHFGLKSAGVVGGIRADGDKITFERGTMDEWFINDARGIEHGFDVREAPPRSGKDGFRVMLDVATSLTPEVRDRGRSTVFLDSEGNQKLRYGGLLVLDKSNTPLPAKMEVSQNGTDSWQLALHVDDRGAQYPLTIDPVLTTNTAYLKAQTELADDQFGYSISMSGNLLAVGIPSADSPPPVGVDGGGVALFRYLADTRSWELQRMIYPENPVGAGSFGLSVELDGQTLIVGAPNDNSSGALSGSAYLFQMDQGGMNQWGQVSKLIPADGQAIAGFGGSVALDGGIAAVGARQQSGAGGELNAGAAYVSLRNPAGDWSSPIRLTGYSPQTNDNLGRAVAVSGTRVAAAAIFGQTGATPVDAGLVAIYDLVLDSENTLISNTTTLVTDANPQALSIFGQAIDLDGDRLFVGSPMKTTSGGVAAGAVAVYQYDPMSGWTWVTQLTAPDGSADDRFGSALSLSGDTLAIGSPLFDESAFLTDNGAIYYFEKTASASSAWSFIERAFFPTKQSDIRYGSSVSVSGDGIAVGVPFFNGAMGMADTGRVETLLRRPSAWINNSAPEYSFSGTPRHGESVAIDRGKAAVGAPRWTVAGLEQGRVSIFEGNKNGEENWALDINLTSPLPETDELFGHSVAIHGNYLLVGAPGRDKPGLPDAGAAYLFRRNNAGGWAFFKGLDVPALTSGAEFGFSVALTSRWAFVGAPGMNFGFVFDRYEGGSDNWDIATILDESAVGGRFGASVVAEGDFAAFSAPERAGIAPPGEIPASLAGAGTVKIYRSLRVAGKTVWDSVKTLPTPDGDGSFGVANANFGGSLALHQGLLAVGAPGYQTETGRVKVFGLNQGGVDAWGEINTLYAPAGQSGDRFGSSLAAGSRWLFAGADGVRRGGIATGAVLTYDRLTLADPTATAVSEIRHPRRRDGDEFGGAMAFSDDELIVGLPGKAFTNGSADMGGHAIYHRQSTAWSALGGALGTSAATGDRLGSSVSVQGDFMVAGAPNDTVSGSASAGSVFLYRRTTAAASGWTFVKTITAGDVQVGALFGSAVDLDGDTLVVGAPGWDSKGAVYVFQRNNGGADEWGQQKRVDLLTTANGDNFGAAVAINGDVLVVGIPGDNIGALIDAGSVSVFERHHLGTSNWGFRRNLTEPAPADFDFFGTALDADDGRILIGAPLADDKGDASGAIYIFQRNDLSTWPFLTSPSAIVGEPNDRLGGAVAIDGLFVIAGAVGESTHAANSGAALLFRDLGGDAVNWSMQAILTVGDFENPAIHANLEFGSAVAIKGDQVAVGARGYDEGALDTIGAVYVFNRNQTQSNGWGMTRKLVATDAGSGARMGAAVAMTHDFIVAGAPESDQGAQIDAGYIFIFGDAGSAYTDWARTIFGDTNVNNSALRDTLWGPNADPDNDGHANALEAFMNTRPDVADGAMSPAPSVLRTASGDFIFRYRQGKETHGAEGRVTWSRSLKEWQGGENSDIDDFDITTRVFEDHDDYFIMEARISGDQLTGEPRLFMRLEINVP